MKLIDANVFIYAVGRPHAYREPCRRLLLQLEKRTVDANIDVELHQEILGFFWRQGRLDDGLALFDRLQRVFPDPLPVTKDIIAATRSFLARYPAVGPRDAIHASVVVVHGLEGIVSTDRGFDLIAGLSRFDPMQL